MLKTVFQLKQNFRFCRDVVCIVSFLPPERDEVSVEWDVLNDPVGEGDLADVDELPAADRVLDRHVFKFLVKEPEKSKNRLI